MQGKKELRTQAGGGFDKRGGESTRRKSTSLFDFQRMFLYKLVGPFLVFNYAFQLSLFSELVELLVFFLFCACRSLLLQA